MKKMIVIILLSITIIGFASLPTSKEVTTKGQIETGQQKQTVVEEEASKEVESAKVGEFIEGETWKISLLSAKQYDVIPDEYFETKPEVEGNKFVVLFFEVENISSYDDHFNMFYFESYIDGYSAQSKTLLSKVEGYSSLSGDVASGKKMKGYVAFEVQPNWQEIEFSYKKFVGNSAKVATFLVTPSQLLK